MATDVARDTIARYLQDAIAAERTFEDQLRTFSRTGTQEDVKQLFATHADETRRQYERLEMRLRSMGSSPSTMKSFLAHLFGMAPTTAQMGHEPEEKNTQHLIIAYAVENSECAMYETLATVAAAAGDTETERLAREIQAEEKRAADSVWALLSSSARDSFLRTAGETARGAF